MWAAAHSPAAIEHGLVRDMALIVLAAAAGVNVALRIGVVESFFNFSLACLFAPLVYSHNSDGSACSGCRHRVCLIVRTLYRVGLAIAIDAMSDWCVSAAAW